MKLFENISSGYKRIATGIAIVAFLSMLYLAMIPGASVAYVYATSGELLSGAFVKIVEWPQYNATTVDGAYTINQVPEGTYNISAWKDGYVTNYSTVTVEGNITTLKDLTLSPGHDWLFAEGSTGLATDAYVLLSNPSDTPVTVDIKYLLMNGTMIFNSSVIPPNSTFVSEAKKTVGNSATFSVQVTSDRIIGAERTMMFPSLNWGGKIISDVHDTIGTTDPNSTWYFAEGSINPSTIAYVQILNSNTTNNALVTVDYMLMNGSVVSTSKIVNKTSRDYFDPKTVLPATSTFSIKVTSDIPIVAERTMVFRNMNWAGKIIDGMHDTIGSTELSNTWYFAEGSINPSTWAYVQIFNPDPIQNALVTVDYMLTNGSVITRSKTVNKTSRDYFDPKTALPATSTFSIRVTSDVPIMSERTMVFANISWGGKIISGFHDTIGSTVLRNNWSIGGGYSGGGVVSYVQILNPNNENATLAVKFMRTNGTYVIYPKQVLKNSRDYISAGSVIGPGWYSAYITSDLPIVIEKTEVYPNVMWNGRLLKGFSDTIASPI